MSKHAQKPAKTEQAITRKKVRRSMKGLAKTKSPVNKPALAVLRRIVKGDRLVGVRSFPYPFYYTLSGEYGKNARTVAAALIGALVEAKLVVAPASSLTQDSITYRATEAGRALAKDGPPPVDDSQLDWTLSA